MPEMTIRAEIYRIGETSEEHPLIQKKRAVEDGLGNIAFRLSLAESYTRPSQWDSFLETLPIPDENTEENN